MNRKEIAQIVLQNNIDNNNEKLINALYGTKVPELVSHLISNPEPYFSEDGSRFMCYSEILSANDELHFNFVQAGIIPLIDCCENDFIVYLFKIDKWAMFNLNDEIIFKQSDTIDELL